MPRFVIWSLFWVVLAGAATAWFYQPVARQEARIHMAAKAGDDAVVIAAAADYLSRNACLPGAPAVARVYLTALLHRGRNAAVVEFCRYRPELAEAALAGTTQP